MIEGRQGVSQYAVGVSHDHLMTDESVCCRGEL